MAETLRVLQVLASLDRGGAEATVMDWLRRIDRDRIIFDFVVNESDRPFAFESEALALGSRVIRSPRFKLWNILPYGVWWYRGLMQHPEGGIVHGHHTSPAFVYFAIARVLRRVTIAHSHTAGRDQSLAGRLRVVLRWPLRHLASNHLTCSELAGYWMFGHSTLARLIPNGIETTRFGYDATTRQQIRRQLGLTDALVVGHVGSFSSPKNHSRLLRIFSTVLKTEHRARLLLVGDGALRAKIEKDIHLLGLEGTVSLVGVREDVPELLSAMDVLLFPSHYEGFPVTVVEAQASGLPCVVSDAVTPEIGLTDLVTFVSLTERDEVWAVKVLQLASQTHRESRVKELREAGYDAAQVAKELQEFYLELAQPSR